MNQSFVDCYVEQNLFIIGDVITCLSYMGGREATVTRTIVDSVNGGNGIKVMFREKDGFCVWNYFDQIVVKEVLRSQFLESLCDLRNM